MTLKGTLSKILKSIITALFVVVISLQTPVAYRQYIRNIAEDNSVKIVGMDGMGTGFHVQAPNGKTYILTNKHVCSITGPLKVEKYGDKVGVVRKIIAKYDSHDLCVMEALPGVKGIKISSDPAKNGDRVYTLGHPRGNNLNVAEGEKFDEKVITLGEETQADGTCAEGTLVEIPTLFGIFKICAVERTAVQISSPTYPGNSGSPVVNIYGRVVGVIFAGSRDVENQGFYVPLEVVKDFLSSLK